MYLEQKEQVGVSKKKISRCNIIIFTNLRLCIEYVNVEFSTEIKKSGFCFSTLFNVQRTV